MDDQHKTREELLAELAALREQLTHLEAHQRSISPERGPRVWEFIQRQLAAMEAAIDGMAILNREGVYLYLNPAHAQIYGYGSPEELLGQTWRVLYDEAELRRFDAEIMPLLQRDGHWRGEATGKRKDGSTFPQALSLSLLPDGGIICIVRDITAEQRDRAALAASEERFRCLVESMDDIVFTLDTAQRHTGVYGHWLERYGTKPEVFLGKTTREVLGDAAAPPHEEANRRALAGESITYEWSAPGPGGLSHFQTTVSPLRDASGDVVGIVGVGRDITSLRRAEEVLAARARQQEALARLARRALAPLELDQLFTEATQLVAETLAVEYSKVLELLPGGEELLLRAGVGWREGLVGVARVRADTASQAGYTLLTDAPVLVEDLAQETRFTPLPLLREHGVVSGMSVVIPGEMRPFGVLGAHTRRRRAFTQDEARFLQSMAHLLALAIEHQKTEQALAQRQRELETLNRLGLALAQTLDLDEVCRIAHTHVAQLVDCSCFGISLWDAAEGTLRAAFMVSDGETLDISRFPPLRIPPAPARGRGRAIVSGAPELVEDVPAAAQANGAAIHVGTPGDERVARTALYVPMLVQGQVRGLLEVQSYRPQAYSAAQVALLQPVANWIGLALENAQLFREARRYAAELEARLAELRQAHEELQRSNARLNTLIDHSPVPIWTLTPQGIVTRWNAAAERVFGWSAQEALGQTLPIIPLEAEEEFRALIQRVTGGESLSGLELRRRRRDGTMIDISVYATPIRDAQGQVAEIMAVVLDITSQKQAIEALRESERRFRELLETADLIAIILDLEGRILFCNDFLLNLTGWKREEIWGRNWLELFIAPELRESLRARLFEPLSSGHILIYNDNEILTRSGQRRLIHWTNVPLRDRAGAIIGIASLGEDITERKRLEEQLRQAQKMEVVGRLAGGVAHDFNNLLTAIGGYATFAQDALPPDHPARPDLEQVLKTVARAARLTGQLLAFSRRQTITPQPLNLNDVVTDASKMLRRLIGEDIELVLALASDLGTIQADPGQLEQVLLNLAVNARDAMPNGGKLIIETANVDLDEAYVQRHLGARPGPHVLLAVTDSGVGMSDEVKQHLFEPFFTTKEPGKGTGLGLATVFGIVKQNGGNIWVYSELGQGTTFKIYLPRVDAPAEALPLKDELGYLPRGRETILVVEDEAAVREIAVRTLVQLGYRVLQASDGAEALAVASTYPGEIHLLATDVVMPQMNGKELADCLQKVRPGLRVLFLSGYTSNAIVHHNILERGVVLIQKPFTASALARKVREALERNPIA